MLDKCFRIGISDGCDPKCFVYLNGDCSEPEEMVEVLSVEKLQVHISLYGEKMIKKKMTSEKVVTEGIVILAGPFQSKEQAHWYNNWNSGVEGFCPEVPNPRLITGLDGLRYWADTHEADKLVIETIDGVVYDQ